jgi:hypothetical protein
LGSSIIIIVIVSIAGNYVLRRIIAVPSVRVPSVPVVSPVRVSGPVAAEADKDKPAVVIRPEIAE